uniref:Nipped-B protein n=1 Tax=Macrostomum lignano TaxID=282301 RepID=A0A1I8FGJ8_9PLAT
SAEGSSESRYPPIAKGNSDRPRERVKCGLGVNLGVLSTEELVASETFVHFKELVDQALDAVEDVDIKVLDDSDELPAELKIPSRLLSDLCAKANQMKAVGAMKEMPVDRLVRLLSLLLANIKDGAKLVPFAKPAEDAEDTEGRLWRELCMERVMRSVERDRASRGVAKFQLNSTVYPEADPAYRKTSQHKALSRASAASGGQGARPRCPGCRSGGGRPRALTHLLNRLVGAGGTGLRQLVDLQRLTDNAILAMSGLAVAPFFVENVENLQAQRPAALHQRLLPMLTALSLLLVQSVVLLPASVRRQVKDQDNTAAMALLDAYESARKTAQVFLVVFLNKCAKKAEEQDYRGIFEKFVEDLLLAVNKPEWPAAEMFLSLLGGLLVKQFADRSVDQALRVASLDYLGTVASRLRKDAVTSEMSEQDLDSLVAEIRGHSRGLEASGAGASSATAAPDEAPITKEERIVILQKAIVDYLNAEDVDASVHYAVRFYLAQWYKDCAKEVERTLQQQRDAANNDESAVAHESLDVLESRRTALLVRSCEFGAADSQQLASKRRLMSTGRSDAYMLDYEEACLVCRYLASMRPFSQSFDIYLSQILKVLNEQSVAVRTKAIKCLTARCRVGPVGAGAGSRHRAEQFTRAQAVIKIFRDICVEQPDFNKIPEMCVKMIRRVNDEEGIRKLVNEVFQAMWFSPVKESHNVKLLQKVMNITDVVAACKDQPAQRGEEEKLRPVEKACRQIVDTLVANIMPPGGDLQQHKPAPGGLPVHPVHADKIRPNLMVDHASTLQSYLKIKISSQQDNYVLHYVAKILELTVPLMEPPDEESCRSIEQEMCSLTDAQGHDWCMDSADRLRAENMAPAAEAHRSSRQKPSILRGLYTVGCCLKYFDFGEHHHLETWSYHYAACVQLVSMVFCSQCCRPGCGEESLMALALCAPAPTRTCCFMDTAEDYYCDAYAPVPMVSDETKTLPAWCSPTPPGKEHVQQESLNGDAQMLQQRQGQHGAGRLLLQRRGRFRLAALTMVVTHPAAGPDPPGENVGTPIPAIRSKADAQLMEIEKHYPSFINIAGPVRGCARASSCSGCFGPAACVRGIRDPDADPPVAMNHHLYSMLRTNRMNRRVLLTSMLNLFDENPKPVEDYLLHSRGIALLLSLKQYLKELYGISDSKVQNYSPSDSAKTWETPLNRRPTTVKLAADILDFEDLMLTIDPNDAGGASGDEEGGGGGGGRAAAGTSSAGAAQRRQAVSAKQLPYHPAVQRGLDLKVQLTRIAATQPHRHNLISRRRNDGVRRRPSSRGLRMRRWCRCLPTIDGAEQRCLASQGPRIKMRSRAEAPPRGCQIWRLAPSASGKASLSRESENSPSSD